MKIMFGVGVLLSVYIYTVQTESSFFNFIIIFRGVGSNVKLEGYHVKMTPFSHFPFWPFSHCFIWKKGTLGKFFWEEHIPPMPPGSYT